MALLRNGLSYSQASDNASRKALREHNAAIVMGKTSAEAVEIYRKVYNEEMDWYES